MARSVEALITPSVIKWAREKAGYDLPAASKKIGRPASEIEAWESGEIRPSLAQARRAAEVYKFSLAVFYLPTPPKGFSVLRDLRQLPGKREGDYSPQLQLLIRKTQARQEWLRELLVSEGAKKLEFIGTARIDEPVSSLASAIRKYLHITPENQIGCKDHREALNLWIDSSEMTGINICREGSVESSEARGFALVDFYAPFIYINSQDAIAGQLFTLIHEMAHLWLNESGVSDLGRIDERSSSETMRIEVYCNRIAGEVLLEPTMFDQIWGSSYYADSLEDRIEDTANQFKVSEEAVARRLLDKGIINDKTYRELRNRYIDRWKELRELKRKGSGFAHPDLVTVIRNGRSFTQVVLSAYRSSVISGADASYLLGRKISHFKGIEEYAFKKLV